MLLPLPPAPVFEVARTGEIPLARAQARVVRLARDGFDLPAPITGVELFRVRYPSTGEDGAPRTLTALLAIPAGGVTKGLVLEFHGTIADRRLSPSRYRGGLIDVNAKDPQPTNPEAEAVALSFATGGYAVAMPDYLGLGDDPGVHPYPLAKLNARSGTDLVTALRSARTDLNGPLWVTGYSEGGAVAMWAVRQFEASNVPVAAASPMSGPYDLSGVTARSLLRSGQRVTGLGEKLYLLGYTAYSAQARDPKLDLREYFTPSMASYIPFLFRQNAPQGTVGRKLVIKALQLGARESVVRTLTNRFRIALETGDATDPLIALLQTQDTCDWTPRTKMLLPFLGNDGVVVPQNTTHALAAMRARGVGPDLVRGYQIEPRRGLGHGTAAGPALAATRRFFDGGFAGVGPEVAPITVDGTVTLKGATGAKPTIRLVDRSDPRVPVMIAETTGTPFRLEYERARLLPNGRYELQVAEPYRGSRRFRANDRGPVELKASLRPEAASRR